jgi:hypothetical protein
MVIYAGNMINLLCIDDGIRVTAKSKHMLARDKKSKKWIDSVAQTKTDPCKQGINICDILEMRGDFQFRARQRAIGGCTIPFNNGLCDRVIV